MPPRPKTYVILPADAPQPWERQTGESIKAFAAFTRYRNADATKRNIRGMMRNDSKSAARWSQVWNWTERARAWDGERDRVAREATLAELADMNRRHANIAVSMIGKAAARLASLDPSELTPTELRAFFNDAARLERLARGQAESVNEQRGEGTVRVVVKWDEQSEEL